jgi:hypothetical protein
MEERHNPPPIYPSPEISPSLGRAPPPWPGRRPDGRAQRFTRSCARASSVEASRPAPYTQTVGPVGRRVAHRWPWSGRQFAALRQTKGLMRFNWFLWCESTSKGWLVYSQKMHLPFKDIGTATSPATHFSDQL